MVEWLFFDQLKQTVESLKLSLTEKVQSCVELEDLLLWIFDIDLVEDLRFRGCILGVSCTFLSSCLLGNLLLT